MQSMLMRGWMALIAGTLASTGLAGCASSRATEAASTGPTSQVIVFNDSPFTLTNVRISTGEHASFVEPRLERGQMSSAHVVTEMHHDPAVSLTADGEALSSTPVEGFTGFNPALAAGHYTITITVTGSPKRAIVTVSQPVEN
jgi:hypothetical protein